MFRIKERLGQESGVRWAQGVANGWATKVLLPSDTSGLLGAVGPMEETIKTTMADSVLDLVASERDVAT